MTDTPPAVLPPDPEKSGWHWLRCPNPEYLNVAEWHAAEDFHPTWTMIWKDGVYEPADLAAAGYAYACPVDPPGTATALADARAEVARLRQEIRRLKAIIRINALRHGYTDAEIEAVLRPRAAGTAQ